MAAVIVGLAQFVDHQQAGAAVQLQAAISALMLNCKCVYKSVAVVIIYNILTFVFHMGSIYQPHNEINCLVFMDNKYLILLGILDTETV